MNANIINSNALPSKNNTTLVSNRQNINVDEDGHSGDINNNNNNLNYFYHILH